MNMDQLRRQFNDEQACQRFFEAVRWTKETICPHCGYEGAYRINLGPVQRGRYEFKRCKRHYTVTTKTVLHSTKLPLWMFGYPTAPDPAMGHCGSGVRFTLKQ